jgi:glucose 1-dehydrogenase
LKAIALIPGTTSVRLVERPEPQVTAPELVKLKVVRVGICGTGQTDLVFGHEMFGAVVEVGQGVTRVKPGDHAVFTVRRGCGKCLPCTMNRSDMCRTGEYRERGIWGLDGYQTEYVVDAEQYVVRVPPELEPVGVLSEPLSVAEKAIDEVVRIQSARLPDSAATPDWLSGRRCLIAGLGPIGLLAAVALVLRGAHVFGLDVVDETTARPQWLARIGGEYVDARKVSPEKIGGIELILDATGVASVEFNLLDALADNGVYVLTGIPGGDRPLQIPGAELLRKLVLGNQAMVGSVNAARDHYQMAVEDLDFARLRWGDQLSRLVTNRHPFSSFDAALRQHEPDEIKTVIEWS